MWIFNSHVCCCWMSLHASLSLSCCREMKILHPALRLFTWLIGDAYVTKFMNGIQKDHEKLKKDSSCHDNGNTTSPLLVVKEVKKEKAGIFPEIFTQVNSPRLPLINAKSVLHPKTDLF